MNLRVATITLNPAYDLMGCTNQITLGDVNLLQTTGLFAAGKGINVAKVLRHLGSQQVSASGFLGEENQGSFEQTLQQEGINDQFFRVAGRNRINVKVTEENGEVTDLNFSGFEVSAPDWELFATQSLTRLEGFDMVSVNGSLPSGVDFKAFTQWMERLKAQCPRLVFDSSRAAFIAGLKAIPWLIKPNEKELGIWEGRPLSSIEDIYQVAMKLVQQGIEHVVVSMGRDGALWVSEKTSWLAKPPSCEVVSTVGAGDSMVAGLMYGLLQNQNVPDVFRLASAVAALSVTQSNVGQIDPHALQQMLPQVELRQL